MAQEFRPRRRTVILGAGLGASAAALAAACSSPGTTSTGSPAAASSSSGAPGSDALAKTSAVPVGSALIVGDVVLTQPTPGVFKGFSSVCPHAGCNVSKVVDAKIVCPCHGSEFNLDGSVAEGPAKKPLETTAVVVKGDSIVAG
jgi:Rieske Fe-S protein